jgi:hypothetical protein
MGSCHFPDRETEVRRRKGLVHHAEGGAPPFIEEKAVRERSEKPWKTKAEQ